MELRALNSNMLVALPVLSCWIAWLAYRHRKGVFFTPDLRTVRDVAWDWVVRRIGKPGWSTG